MTNLEIDTRRQAGFTLIEMLASIFLTSVVLTVAVSFYIDLSRATEAATLKLRNTRHAATIIDRVARDLQSAILVVKPAETDPIEHPWIFLAEASLTGEGADRVKFVARNSRSHATIENPSDLAVVSYLLEPSEDFDESFELYRFSSPRLPEGLDRDFPELDDPSARLVARDVSSFSLRFRANGGDWVDLWDSSTLLASGQLPDEVEVSVALLDESVDSADDFDDSEEPRVYTRRVSLPLRPIDIQKQIDQAVGLAGRGSGEGGCITVGECIGKPQNQALWQAYFDRCASDARACANVETVRAECYTQELLPGAVGCGQ